MQRIPPVVRHLLANGIGLLPPDSLNLFLSPFLSGKNRLAPGDKATTLCMLLNSKSERDFYINKVSLWKQPEKVVIQGKEYALCADNALQAYLGANLYDHMMYTDSIHYLPNDILVKIDRASMLNSLEVRAPFLDYRLIEFAFGKVPSNLKATHRDKKILLKHLTERLLPPQFDRQRKQGFSIPLTQWLKAGPFRELFWSILTDSQCLFDRQTVQSLLRGQDRGRSNGERLFALVLFELWRKEYKVTL
jgi:asparagine synthase (glutamine-hydrolysing)